MGSDQVAANRNSGVSIWGGMNESKHHSSLTEAQRLPVTYSNAMCAVKVKEERVCFQMQFNGNQLTKHIKNNLLLGEIFN